MFSKTCPHCRAIEQIHAAFGSRRFSIKRVNSEIYYYHNMFWHLFDLLEKQKKQLDLILNRNNGALEIRLHDEEIAKIKAYFIDDYIIPDFNQAGSRLHLRHNAKVVVNLKI